MLSDDLHSTARIARHPIHPMIVPFPIACFVGALLTDLSFAEPRSEPGQRHQARLRTFMRAARRQIAPHNIRIGSIAPGTVLPYSSTIWRTPHPPSYNVLIFLAFV
jgi:hypothetical protein